MELTRRERSAHLRRAAMTAADDSDGVLSRRQLRALVTRLIDDIADGAQSIGELDLVPALRQRGLPAPTRQAVRVVDGRARYLDACWEDSV